MPETIIVHDALNALAQGHLLRKVGGMSSGLYLEQVPEIALVFDGLLHDGYLREIEVPDQGPDSIRFFTLSDSGRAAWQRTRSWYRALPWYLKLWGRLGLPLPR